MEQVKSFLKDMWFMTQIFGILVAIAGTFFAVLAAIAAIVYFLPMYASFPILIIGGIAAATALGRHLDLFT